MLFAIVISLPLGIWLLWAPCAGARPRASPNRRTPPTDREELQADCGAKTLRSRQVAPHGRDPGRGPARPPPPPTRPASSARCPCTGTRKLAPAGSAAHRSVPPSPRVARPQTNRAPRGGEHQQDGQHPGGRQRHWYSHRCGCRRSHDRQCDLARRAVGGMSRRFVGDQDRRGQRPVAHRQAHRPPVDPVMPG